MKRTLKNYLFSLLTVLLLSAVCCGFLVAPPASSEQASAVNGPTPLVDGETIDALYINRSEEGIAAIKAIADAVTYTGDYTEGTIEMQDLLILHIGEGTSSGTEFMILPLSAFNNFTDRNEFNAVYENDGFILINAEEMFPYYASETYMIVGDGENEIGEGYSKGWHHMNDDGRAFDMYGEPINGVVEFMIIGDKITKEMIDKVFSSTPF